MLYEYTLWQKSEIHLIKDEFRTDDINVANLIWHLGSGEYIFRTQAALVRVTGFSENLIDEIVRAQPAIFSRGNGKDGKIIYKLHSSAKEKFLKISAMKK